MPPKANKTSKGPTAQKVITGGQQRPASSKPKKNEDGIKPKSVSEKRIEMLELENMMLRKNLNIHEIQREFKTSGLQEDYMITTLAEFLHDLELRIKQNESNTEVHVSGDLCDVQKELASARDEIEKLRQETTKMNKQIYDEDNKLQEKDKELQAQKENIREIKTIKVEKENLEKELRMIKFEKENIERKLHEASKKISQKENEIKEKEIQHSKLIRSKEEIIQKLQKEKSVVESTGSRNCKTETKCNEKTENELRKAKEEIEVLKNRLSKFVGANILNDDPNISELSDENRPTKLSEKFCELYDNEWTDAYEEVENVFKTEKEAVGYLYNALQDVFVYCKTISEEHAKKISASVLNVPSASYDGRNSAQILSDTTPRQLQFLTKEFRKRFAPYLVDSVFQHFVSARRVTVANKKRTEAFLKKCVEICWLMNSQDPPVIFDQSDVQGKYFDGDKYRTYTKSGKVVDFVVWPPMLLHENGPLLCKGVAQGK